MPSQTPPDRFVCPISLDVMSVPVLVSHNGNPFWFDQKSLRRHDHSEYRDKNPLTNEAGFLSAPRIEDEELKREIMGSAWKPVEVDDETGFDDQVVPTRGTRVNPLASLPQPWRQTLELAMAVGLIHNDPTHLTGTNLIIFEM